MKRSYSYVPVKAWANAEKAMTTATVTCASEDEPGNHDTLLMTVNFWARSIDWKAVPKLPDSSNVYIKNSTTPNTETSGPTTSAEPS